MPQQEFLIMTSEGNGWRKTVWNPKKPLQLNPPSRWILAKGKGGIQALSVDKDQKVGVFIDYPDLDETTSIELPVISKDPKAAPIQLKISRLKAIRPAFVPSPPSEGRQLSFLYSGSGNAIFGCKRVGRRHWTCVGDAPIFDYSRTAEGHQITPRQKILHLHLPGNQRKVLPANVPTLLTDQEILDGVFRFGRYWWRVIRVPQPRVFGLQIDDKTATDEDWIGRASKGMILTFLAAMIIIPVISKYQHKPKIISQTKVALKEPKWVPPVIEKVVEPVKEPVKAKSVPPPPAGKPRELAKGKPSSVPKGSSASSQSDQQIAESLNFLSPSKNRSLGNVTNVKSPSKNRTPSFSSVTPTKDTKTTDNGPIATRSARQIEGGRVTGTGGSDTGVKGKVSVSALYSGTGEGGGISEGGGLSVSGEGSLSQEAVQKALEKYLAKFQYCYERSLLTNSALSGIVVLEWTIKEGGSVSEPRVVRSELRQEDLHQCMIREVSKIRFPSPKGGPVKVKYPFSFASGTI